MQNRCVWEHNGNDSLLYSVDYAGAFTRGESREIALGKMRNEIASYLDWTGKITAEMVDTTIVQEKESELQIADADSDVIFDNEKEPLSKEEYLYLKDLALKSAGDFHQLYLSIPDKNVSCLPERKTFYGTRPRTAQEMYNHTKNVNAYYFGEVGINADNEGTIRECRERGFALLEKDWEFLNNPVVEGSYDELWSVRKMLRRFIWHDRIHARAMYRMAVKTFGADRTGNPFSFIL